MSETKRQIIFCPNNHEVSCSADDKGNITYPSECRSCEGTVMNEIPFMCPSCGEKHWPLDDTFCPNEKESIHVEVRINKLAKQLDEELPGPHGLSIAMWISVIGFFAAFIWGAQTVFSLKQYLLGGVSLAFTTLFIFLYHKKINQLISDFIVKHDSEMLAFFKRVKQKHLA